METKEFSFKNKIKFRTLKMSLHKNGFAYEWELFICELAKKVIQKEKVPLKGKRVVVGQFVDRALEEFLVKIKGG
jgi:hypothetical protein